MHMYEYRREMNSLNGEIESYKELRKLAENRKREVIRWRCQMPKEYINEKLSLWNRELYRIDELIGELMERKEILKTQYL